MFTEIFWINHELFEEKSIGIMPRPRGGEWLEDEIRSMKLKKIDCIISLLEYGETSELGLGKEKEYCELYKIDFINFPIEDVNIPKNEERYVELIDEIVERLIRFQRIVIHCRMGIGRSSVIASGVLIQKGVNANEVFEIISKFRKLEVPDTTEQKDWVIKVFKNK